MKQISDIEKRDLINLFLGFKYLSEGYFEDEIESYPNLHILIQEGLTFTDEKTNLIKLNDKGDIFFHKLIKEISEEYIAFLKKKGFEISLRDMASWFEKKYELESYDDGMDLGHYISKNLHNYGYGCRSAYSSKDGKKYCFIKS